MINLSVCDDDQFICSQLKTMLQSFGTKNGIKMEIHLFHESNELCEYLQRNECELVFLDIEFSGTSGVDTGKFIREKLKNYKIQIVYISHESQYAMQLFQTHPFDFLVKPIEYEMVENVMDKYMQLCQYSNDFVEFCAKKRKYKIPYNEILYFKSDGRQVNVILKDKKITFYKKLSELLKELSPNVFLAIHKSFVININYVSIYYYESITLLNGETLNVSRNYINQVREKMAEYMIAGQKIKE